MVLIAVGVVIALVAMFWIGRASVGESPLPDALASTTTIQGDTSTTTSASSTSTLIDGDPTSVLIESTDQDVPEYGSEDDRDDFISALTGAGVSISSRARLLMLGDRICFDLERLMEQNRSPAFAVRVVWNESLDEIDSRDVAAFGVVFNATPPILCPQVGAYAVDVAYWLGI